MEDIAVQVCELASELRDSVQVCDLTLELINSMQNVNKKIEELNTISITLDENNNYDSTVFKFFELKKDQELLKRSFNSLLTNFFS